MRTCSNFVQIKSSHLTLCAFQDIQYVGEKSKVLNLYISAYISKKEEREVTDSLGIYMDKHADSTGRTTWQTLLGIMCEHMRSRDVGVYEVVVRLLGLPMSGSSETIDYLGCVAQ